MFYANKAGAKVQIKFKMQNSKCKIPRNFLKNSANCSLFRTAPAVKVINMGTK